MVVTLQPFLIHLTRLLSKNYTKSALKTSFLFQFLAVVAVVYHLAVHATVQDFTIGWPGLLLQVFGAYFVCKYL